MSIETATIGKTTSKKHNFHHTAVAILSSQLVHRHFTK